MERGLARVLVISLACIGTSVPLLAHADATSTDSTASSTPSSVAADDEYRMDAGSVLIAGSIGEATASSTESNDTLDPSYPAEAVCDDTGPSHQTGRFILYSDGSFRYQPAADFVGTDSFTYILCDDPASAHPKTLAGPATVTIKVGKSSQMITLVGFPEATSSIPAAPVPERTGAVAEDDAYAMEADTMFVAGNLPGATASSTLANDTLDPAYPREGLCDGTPPAHNAGHAANGKTMNYALLSDGSFRYRPEAGFVGTDSFTYYLCDDPSIWGPNGSGSETRLSDPVTVTIYVEEVPMHTVQVGSSVTLSATASSGLPVMLAVNGACTLSGSTLSFTAVGTCSITASQPGDEDYVAAPDVVRSIPVTAPPPPPPAPTTPAVDSVLFLPGIEGSRLYEGTGCGGAAEEKLWDPVADSNLGVLSGAGDAKVRRLFLDANGESICPDIYTKEGGVLDTVRGASFYAPLMGSMDALVASTTIDMRAWEPIAYDWRLSLDDLIANGAERDGRIYYEEATGTPYIVQELRRLAQASATGKVTIIAHSNGGLVAKKLLQSLGDAEASKLVDKLILVAVPQTGAPEDIGSLLVGYNAGIYHYDIPIVSNAAARAFAQDSPMAYHLLPSEDYLESTAPDNALPVVKFESALYQKEADAYGSTIANRSALDDFLLAAAGDREKPDEADLNSLEILNPTLIHYANTAHAALDTWTPPASIEVDQIAGWGNDTVAGIDFYDNPLAKVANADAAFQKEYRPIFTEDGDGTVPTPSALQMASSTSVHRYWVDLNKILRTSGQTYKHADIFAAADVRSFINGLLGASSIGQPDTIYPTQPKPIKEDKKLIFILHSPLTLQLTDSSGNATGLSANGSVTQNISGAEYGQFGETQYVIAPAGSSYTVQMHGKAAGTFSLDLEESEGGTITASSSITNVPTTANTTATLAVSGSVSGAGQLSVDENGDGSDVITVVPQAGKTVTYQPPQSSDSETTGSSAGDGSAASGSGGSSAGSGASASAGSISVPVVASVPAPAQVVSTSTAISTETQEGVASSTKDAAVASAKEVHVEATSATRALRMATQTLPATASRARPESASSTVSAGNLQAASVYAAASQQPWFTAVAAAVYNGIYNAWRFILHIL
ncbi:MAG: hypothetical protein KGI41_02170 [Patescibacteria group bacterium]|nr:hypothetical protein [Patescibacteria group bacterium]MDE1966019.1 hypothetical protein [Patescibacteria group bacterium]